MHWHRSLPFLLFMFSAPIGTANPTAAQFVFGPAVDYGNFSGPSGLTVEDFDRDSDLDLATTAEAADRVVRLINAGNGTFGNSLNTLLPASSSPQDVIAGDFDGDQDLDLAVALRDPIAQIQFLTNSGAGAFALGASVPVGTLPRGLSVGDFDRDSDSDLAVANRNSNSMSILTNNGGSFTVSTVPVGSSPRATIFGNFLNDTSLEIAVSNQGSRTVTILDQVGGVFTPVNTLSVGPGVRPDGLVAANLDGVGLDDLAVATGSPPDSATVFINNGAGFNAAVNYPTGGTNSSEVVAADFNGDARRDLVVLNRDSNNVSLVANNGNGTFGASQVYAIGSDPVELVFGDGDRDGDPDLAVANLLSNNVSVMLNLTCTVPRPADFNGDGNGLVNQADLTQWLAVAGAANLPSGNPYLAGDAHLDGSVDGLDSNRWNASKFTMVAAWCSGDFSADGVIDGSDFSLWNSHKFTSAAA